MADNDYFIYGIGMEITVLRQTTCTCTQSPKYFRVLARTTDKNRGPSYKSTREHEFLIKRCPLKMVLLGMDGEWRMAKGISGHRAQVSPKHRGQRRFHVCTGHRIHQEAVVVAQARYRSWQQWQRMTSAKYDALFYCASTCQLFCVLYENEERVQR